MIDRQTYRHYVQGITIIWLSRKLGNIIQRRFYLQILSLYIRPYFSSALLAFSLCGCMSLQFSFSNSLSPILFLQFSFSNYLSPILFLQFSFSNSLSLILCLPVSFEISHSHSYNLNSIPLYLLFRIWRYG